MRQLPNDVRAHRQLGRGLSGCALHMLAWGDARSNARLSRYLSTSIFFGSNICIAYISLIYHPSLHLKNRILFARFVRGCRRLGPCWTSYRCCTDASPASIPYARSLAAAGSGEPGNPMCKCNTYSILMVCEVIVKPWAVGFSTESPGLTEQCRDIVVVQHACRATNCNILRDVDLSSSSDNE